jgi:hypothetical protein
VNPEGTSTSSGTKSWTDARSSPSSAESIPLRRISSTFFTPDSRDGDLGVRVHGLCPHRGGDDRQGDALAERRRGLFPLAGQVGDVRPEPQLVEHDDVVGEGDAALGPREQATYTDLGRFRFARRCASATDSNHWPAMSRPQRSKSSTPRMFLPACMSA